MEQAVWIVHADAQAQTALARMAGLPARVGPPRLEAFPAAPAPSAIVLHVPLAADDALAFAHSAAARHPRAVWLLIAEPGLGATWLRSAFAGLRLTSLAWPVQPAAFQEALGRALAGSAPSLTALRSRDALVARLTRTLGDLALPQPLLDASGHLAIRGERGTGKLLLARTLHALWNSAEDGGRAGFVLLAGDASANAAQLEARIAEAAERTVRLVVCVEDPAALPPALQRELASWVELGAPGAALDPTRLLWAFLRPESFGASAPLEGALAELCESPALRIPPLRERPGAALALAEQWLREWYAATNELPRALAESARDAIDGDPWPGNARELEAALRRAVVTARDARGRAVGDAEGPQPIEASELGLTYATPLDLAGDVREFESVSEELDAARADEASPSGDEASPSGDEAPARAQTPERAGRRAQTAEVVDAILAAPPRDVSPKAPPTSAQPPDSDLRTFARAAARELAPALEALRARANDPAAALVARRLARLEQFASIEVDPTARTEVAQLLAAVVAERREELQAKRLLVLRELESDDTQAQASEPALRFAFSALLDTLLEAALPRTDLYVSARVASENARAIVRAELRLSGAKVPAGTLDLTLARDLLTRLGATLTVDSNASETHATIDLAR